MTDAEIEEQLREGLAEAGVDLDQLDSTERDALITAARLETTTG